jgi:hypothetical protein
MTTLMRQHTPGRSPTPDKRLEIEREAGQLMQA